MKRPDDHDATSPNPVPEDASSAMTVHASDDSPYGRGLLALRGEARIVPTDAPDVQNATGFLRLAAHVLLRAQRDRFCTIGVVSARDGDGKTTTAVNLAVCLGRTRGRAGRVLLVDGDVKNRDLTHKICGGERPTNGEAVRAAQQHPMLVATAFECVDLMTAPVALDGATLYDPAAWAQTLHDLSERYAQIVIDCPAVLDHPEGLILRECAEELVLVVKSGQTKKADVEAVVGGSARRVLGVVMTGAPGEGQ